MDNQKLVEDTLAWFESHLRNGKFEEVNNLLNEIDVSSINDTVILVILTITFWGKDKLPARPKFLAQAEIVLKQNLGEERGEKLLKNRR